jgi:hypothetical protein
MNEFSYDLGRKVRQIITFPELKRQIEKAPQLAGFQFAIINPSDLIKKMEPDSLKMFTFSFSNGSNVYSLLKALQSIGFDPFITVGSYPKGEDFTLIHGDIAYLARGLDQEHFPVISHPLIENKLRLDLRHGRLHVRFYKLKGLVASVHVDPPDIKHFNIIEHVAHRVKTDYPAGERLFKNVLSFLIRTS